MPTNHTSSIPQIEFETFTLDNGLRVILHLDRKLPIVHVNQWFHVGSKNEKPGRTGFAHLFEHLMFEGSTNAPDGYFPYVERAGANLREGGVNGTTSHDRTNYFSTVPSGNLEYVLWLESDRVATLADALTPENFENQRDVVRNERRQTLENRPYGNWIQLMSENLYPAGHPYSWPVIGSHEDLEAASVDDVRTFFQTYYTPNNLSLVIAGDFDPDNAKRLVEKYYGGISPGPLLTRPSRWIPGIDGSKVINVEARVPQTRTYLTWTAPARFEEDEVKLDIASSVLWEGLSSRLKKCLVYEHQLCTDVMASDMSMELSGIFVIVASARPGSSITDIEAMITEEIERLALHGPTAEEMERSLSSWELKFVSGLERIGGFGGKADRLNESNIFKHDPGYFMREYEHFTRQTEEDVRQAVDRWINTEDCLTIRYHPEPVHQSASVTLDRSQIPDLGADTRFQIPHVQKGTLDNGLEVFVIERPELPKVSVTLATRMGSVADPADKYGTAHMTMMTIDKGTQTQTAIDIAEALGRLGMSLQGSTYHEYATLGFEVLSRHLDGALHLFSDIILNPLFSEPDVDREIKRHLDTIAQYQSNPQALAARVGPMLAFGPDHPYGRPVHGFVSSVSDISRLDVIQCHEQHWHPNDAALIMVGDITLDTALQLSEQHLGAWAGDTSSTPAIPEPHPMEPESLYIIDRPDTPQTVVYQVLPAPERTSSDYYALRLVDVIWGNGFSSRLNHNLREDKGFTYGISSILNLNTTSGSWRVQSAVDTEKTGETLHELVKELGDIAGARPVTENELEEAQVNRLRGYVQQFETLRRIGGQIAYLWGNRLPFSELENIVTETKEMTMEAVHAAVGKHLNTGSAAYLLIGDRAKIEEQVRDQNWRKIVILDEEGRELAD